MEWILILILFFLFSYSVIDLIEMRAFFDIKIIPNFTIKDHYLQKKEQD